MFALRERADRGGDKAARFFVTSAPSEGQPLLPAGMPLDETREQRKIDRQVFEQVREIALQGPNLARRCLFARRRRIAPRGKLVGDRLLYRLAKREICCTARSSG